MIDWSYHEYLSVFVLYNRGTQPQFESRWSHRYWRQCHDYHTAFALCTTYTSYVDYTRGTQLQVEFWWSNLCRGRYCWNRGGDSQWSWTGHGLTLSTDSFARISQLGRSSCSKKSYGVCFRAWFWHCDTWRRLWSTCEDPKRWWKHICTLRQRDSQYPIPYFPLLQGSIFFCKETV